MKQLLPESEQDIYDNMEDYSIEKHLEGIEENEMINAMKKDKKKSKLEKAKERLKKETEKGTELSMKDQEFMKLAELDKTKQDIDH